LEKLSTFDFDVLICPGDFTDSVFPKGFTRLDIAKIIVEELKSLKKPLLVVPGSWDGELIGYFEKENISIHGRGSVIGGVGFYGFGGAKTPFNLPYEPGENEIQRGLENAYSMIKDERAKVQVTHAPPARTKIDIITSGAHVGSEVVRKFIEEKKPIAAVSSHIHEARGVDEIGNTKIINSGRFPEGYCGLISIDNDIVNMKVVNLI
jgi:Icc-related predicted phosphoesterase